MAASLCRRLPPRIRVAATNGARPPGVGSRPSANAVAHAVRGLRRLVDRRIEGPVGRAGARQADWPREQPEQRALERHEAGLDDRRRGRKVVGGGEHARPRQQVRDPQAPPQLVAQVRRRLTRRRRRPAARRRRTPRTPPASRSPTAGVTSSRPGRSSGRIARRAASRAASRARPGPRRAPGRRRGRTARRTRARRRSGGASRRSAVHAPRLERRVGRRGGIRGPAGEPGGDRDPLVQARRERRQRLAAPDDVGGVPAGDGERAEDEVVGGRSGVEALDVEAVGRPRRQDRQRRGGPRGRAGPSRCGGRGSRRAASRARPGSGSPSPARAGSRARGGGRRRWPASSRCTVVVTAPGSARSPRRGRSTPRPRRSAAGGRGRSRRWSRAASTCSGGMWSCRVSTLWSILRRSRNPAWTIRHRCSSASASSRSSAANGSSTSTADSTLGAGSKASRGHPERDPRLGVVLDEDRQVRHVAGRRRHAFGDLALEHQDQALRARRTGQQPVQDRARDVVRQVRDDVVRRRHEARRGPGRARRPRSAAGARPRPRSRTCRAGSSPCPGRARPP